MTKEKKMVITIPREELMSPGIWPVRAAVPLWPCA